MSDEGSPSEEQLLDLRSAAINIVRPPAVLEPNPFQKYDPTYLHKMSSSSSPPPVRHLVEEDDWDTQNDRSAYDWDISKDQIRMMAKQPTITAPWMKEVQESQNVFRQRDEAALQYSQNRLIEGDTLVVTSRRGLLEPIYHPLGFVLDHEYRVHSEKLLATGSSYFRKMLGEDEQKKLRTAGIFAGRVGRDGIKFVLDLSPDNEDGEVLLHELSCPDGIRYWFRAKLRNDVPSSLVYGQEETDKSPDAHRNSISSGSEEQGAQQVSTLPGFSPFIPGAAAHGTELPKTTTSGLKRKSVDFNTPNVGAELEYFNKNVPLDYTHVRHRACMERMLQCIEGKHARLDSATKVWTTAMLAGMYDCTIAVVDEITSWVYTSNNNRIIEILPEAIFKLGITLKSYMLTRAAFSILVAEEAFCMRPDTAPSQRSSITPLGRYRDDHTLGEDHLDMIQKAALVFNEQITMVTDDFINPECSWFSNSPEFRKLQAAKDRMESDYAFNKTPGCGIALNSLDDLEKDLRDYYYGRLRVIMTRKLAESSASFGETHRIAEHWSSDHRISFEDYYDNLSGHQRLCIRPFWHLTQYFDPGVIHLSNILLGEDVPEGVRQVSGVSIYRLANEANMAIFDHAIRNATAELQAAAQNSSLAGGFDKQEVLTKMYLASVSEGRVPTDAQSLAHEYTYLQKTNVTHSQSIFFSVHQFCRDASRYIGSIATMMLKRSEDCMGFDIPEGLQCLTDHQYKFLPLWAGGCDDGSGGVGTDIPLPSTEGWDGIGPGMRGFAGTNTATAGASTYRGNEDVESSIDFGSRDFETLGFLSPKRDKGKGRELYSEADSYSDIGHGGAMSEISFASTFDGEPLRSAASEQSGKVLVKTEALDAVMSDDFMLENDVELDIDSDSDGFDMLDDEEDEGENTETED